jgi:hypothetical protein
LISLPLSGPYQSTAPSGSSTTTGCDQIRTLNPLTQQSESPQQPETWQELVDTVWTEPLMEAALEVEGVEDDDAEAADLNVYGAEDDGAQADDENVDATQEFDKMLEETTLLRTGDDFAKVFAV